MKNPHLQAAIHEAGHAISHYVLGDQIRQVQIAQDGRGRTRARPRTNDRSPVTSALTCLAGAAAEARLLGGGYAADCKIDIADARRHLKGTGLTVEQVWKNVALPFADQNRDNIIAVANGLLSQGGLDGDELVTLLRSSGWQSPRWK